MFLMFFYILDLSFYVLLKMNSGTPPSGWMHMCAVEDLKVDKSRTRSFLASSKKGKRPPPPQYTRSRLELQEAPTPTKRSSRILENKHKQLSQESQESISLSDDEEIVHVDVLLLLSYVSSFFDVLR